MQQIFMVGEQRSGSNLLRLILNESGNVAAPHPPHILQRMMPLLPVYGELENESNFSQLIDDVCKLVELNPVPWEVKDLDRKEVRSRCHQNNLVAVYGAVMDIYAEHHQASAWMCKSMQNIRWADDLNQYFSQPKYVYLYRDPRDVALSFTKAVIGEKHPFFITQQWVELQELCLAQREILGEDQFFSLCYEDLTNKPHETVENLCEFLDIEFSESMLNFHESNEAVRSANSSQLWENLVKPINSANSQKYLTELCVADLRIIESVAGEVMDKLGYHRNLIPQNNELLFEQENILQFQEINDELKRSKAKNINTDDLKRRKKQTSFLDKITSRDPNQKVQLKTG